MEIIRLENVNFTYKHQPVLKDINLIIEEGDFVGLIGPNGSGKSTLIKIILGILKPQTGTVKVTSKNIGYVAQRPGSAVQTFPITVGEIMEISGSKRDEWKKALEDVEMADFANKPINELSGGQQQRVFIARALANNPQLLVLDEPTAGVDTESQAEFYQLLKKINQEKKITLLLVSHDIDVIAHEVNHLLCLNKTIICHGRPKDIMKGDFWKELYSQDLKMVVHGH